jgi:hypothetical protein
MITLGGSTNFALVCLYGDLVARLHTPNADHGMGSIVLDVPVASLLVGSCYPGSTNG